MIYFPFFYFLVLLCYYSIRYKIFSIGSILLILYTLSSFCSIVLYNLEFLTYRDSDIKIESCIYYCGILTLFFLPFFYKNNGFLFNRDKTNHKLFGIISKSLIIINVVAILCSLQFILFVFTHNPGSFKIDAASTLSNLGYSIGPFESLGFTLLGYFSGFYIVLLVFFFYSLIFYKNSRKLSFLLLISSMTPIVNGMRVGGRVQMTYWILIFFSCYIFFKNQLPASEKKYIRKTSMVVFLIFILYFASITISRFSDSYSFGNGQGEITSIIVYLGQPFINFNNLFSEYDFNQINLARIFPITYDIFSNYRFDLEIYRQTMPFDSTLFYGFLGDFVFDVGVVGTIIYVIGYLFVSFTIKHMKIRGSYELYQILIFFLLLQIPLHGLFFYSIWNKTATIPVGGTIVISALLFVNRNRYEG
ncbi:MAG: O-antigen polymerase [Bacteroidota bacterium]